MHAFVYCMHLYCICMEYVVYCDVLTLSCGSPARISDRRQFLGLTAAGIVAKATGRGQIEPDQHFLHESVPPPTGLIAKACVQEGKKKCRLSLTVYWACSVQLGTA